jgi:SPP1 family predicted phage head-tail adaptor
VGSVLVALPDEDPRMRAGQMSKKVTVQQATETRDSDGGIIQAWATFATLWCSIEPIKGDEFFAAQTTGATVTHRIRTRYCPGVTPKMRLSWDSRIFNILSVINFKERNAELEIMASEAI